jgi:hypothetical protein
MKKISLSLIYVITLLIASCDIVDLPLEKPDVVPIDITDTTPVSTVTLEGVDQNGYPLIDTNSINNLTQKVYMEEFTGHSCTGCPAQTDKLLAMQANHEGQIIVATFHEGIFAKVELPDYPTDMSSEYGDQLHSLVESSIDAYPSAMVNRKTFVDFGNKLVFQAHNEWQGPALAEVDKLSPMVSMGVGAILNDEMTTIKVRVSTKAEFDLNDEFKLLVLCVEDSVISEQKDGRLNEDDFPHKINKEYIHRHTVRDQVNSSGNVYGETIIDAAGLQAGEWVDWTINYSIPESVIDPEHVYIVASLINATTTEVVQVEETHVHLAK